VIGNCAVSDWWAWSFLATTIRPVVPCRDGARCRPFDAADADRLVPQCAISALTSVPVAWPAAGCTTKALRLVDDDDVVVLEHDIERDVLALRLGGHCLRHVDYDRIALWRHDKRVAHGGVLDGHGTGQDQRLQPDRDSSGVRFASTRSSRTEPSSPATTTSSVRPLFEETVAKEEPCDDRHRATEPTPSRPHWIAQVRRMMLNRGPDLGTGRGRRVIAIGYRLYRSEGSPVSASDVTAALPKGARIVATGVAGDRLVVTLDIGGANRDPHI